MSTATEVPTTTNVTQITNGPSVPTTNAPQKQEETHVKKRSRSPSPREERKKRRKRSHSPRERLSYEERRELERKRQAEERKERKKKGLATETPKLKSKETTEDILKNYRTGGIYIPPFKMRRVQPKIHDKKAIEYQRLNWDALKKAFSGIINKVNIMNIKNIIPELFSENLVRGRGLFARAIMKAQQASPSFTHVYAALLAVVNTKMPQIGELVLKRVIIGFRKAYRRNDKYKCISFCKFIAHLVNQQVAHEILAGQLLGLLLEKPTDDSVELAVQFTKECGYVINQLSPKIMNAVFERFRGILHEGEIDKRVQYLIEGLFAIRKKGFQDYPGVIPELDLVEADDQITHEIELDDQLNPDDQLDYFHYDPDFEENEAEYEQIKKEILGEDDEEEKEEDDEESESEEENKEEEAKQTVEQSDKDLIDAVQLKRNIYLTIMSSLGHEECVHKLIKSGLTENHELEVCSMLIECCSQERTFLQYYGLIGQRFCMLDKIFQEKFAEAFKIQYSMIHRLETNKLRNVAKFFAHLLYTDALPWTVMEYIRLTPNDTTSSSRIFIKILFQELAEHMGLKQLNERLRDEYLQQHFEGLFPKDTAKNTRFAINFFTSIGLGALTEDLREYLKNAPKIVETKESSSSETSESDSDDSDDSDDSSDSDSDSDSDSSSDSDSGSSSTSDSEKE